MHDVIENLNLIKNKVSKIAQEKQLKTDPRIIVVTKKFTIDKILPLVEKNKHLIASLFAYCKQIYITSTKKDRTILERNYEQNKEDFQSYAPKLPEQVDFSIKENEITTEMKQNVKENYDSIMKQRQEELNNITFNKQQNEQATEWINRDKDVEEEDEQVEQKKEETITENRHYEETQ